MKKFLVIVLSIIAVATMFTACTDKSDKNTTTMAGDTNASQTSDLGEDISEKVSEGITDASRDVSEDISDAAQ